MRSISRSHTCFVFFFFLSCQFYIYQIFLRLPVGRECICRALNLSRRDNDGQKAACHNYNFSGCFFFILSGVHKVDNRLHYCHNSSKGPGAGSGLFCVWFGSQQRTKAGFYVMRCVFLSRILLLLLLFSNVLNNNSSFE